MTRCYKVDGTLAPTGASRSSIGASNHSATLPQAGPVGSVADEVQGEINTAQNKQYKAFANQSSGDLELWNNNG